MKNENEGEAGEDRAASVDILSDLSKLRLPSNYESLAGVKKLLTTVPVRKPTRQEFVRVHPTDAYSFNAAVVTWEEDGQVYLVAPTLAGALGQEVRAVELVTAIPTAGLAPTKSTKRLRTSLIPNGPKRRSRSFSEPHFGTG